MLQPIIQFVHTHALVTGLVIGVMALILILVGDLLKKRAYYPKPGVSVPQDLKDAAGAICLGFNIAGFIMSAVSIGIMAWGGCYAQFLGGF